MSISIHALLAESDLDLTFHQRRCIIFLSTLSLRRATVEGDNFFYYADISIHALLAESDGALDGASEITLHFYPRSPCGERPWTRGSRITYVEFLSTLSLRRATIGTLRTVSVKKTFLSTLSLRRATKGKDKPTQNQTFLSTLSLRRATNQCKQCYSPSPISIHALLAESDLFWFGLGARVSYFYPRSPCGERLVNSHKKDGQIIFLSTLSLRRATN